MPVDLEALPLLDEQPADEPAPAPAEPAKRGRPKGARDRAPRRKPPTGSSSTAKRPPSKPAGTAALQRQLEEAIGKLGALLVIAGTVRAAPKLVFDGEVIVAKAGDLATELALLASKNPQLEKWLRQLLAGSDYGRTIMVVASVAVPILANHGVVPVELAAVFGTVPPEVPENGAVKHA